MKNVLVLGSGGRLGRALQHAVALSNESEYRYVFSRREDLDLLNSKATLDYFSVYNPTIVLNLAAKVKPRLDNSPDDADVFLSNLRLVQNVYSASLAVGTTVLIQASSYHTFSPMISPPYPSHSPPGLDGLNFETQYAAAKSAEYLFSNVSNSNYRQSNLKFQIVSMPNLFGPYGPPLQESEHYIGSTIRRMLKAIDQGVEELELFGSPRQKREYLYTLDAANQIVQRFIATTNPSQYSVISSGTILGHRECWDLVAEATGYSGRTVTVPGNQPGTDMYFAEATFEPTDVKDALRNTVNWYLERKASKNLHD